MASVRYQVVRLAGYTDGRPSWTRDSTKKFFDKESAEAEAARRQNGQSKTQFKVRRVVTR